MTITRLIVRDMLMWWTSSQYCSQESQEFQIFNTDKPSRTQDGSRDSSKYGTEIFWESLCPIQESHHVWFYIFSDHFTWFLFVSQKRAQTLSLPPMFPFSLLTTDWPARVSRMAFFYLVSNVSCSIFLHHPSVFPVCRNCRIVCNYASYISGVLLVLFLYVRYPLCAPLYVPLVLYHQSLLPVFLIPQFFFFL